MLRSINNWWLKLFKKDKVKYRPYEEWPGFMVFGKKGHRIMGHMSVKETDTINDMKHNMSKLVREICVKHELSEDKIQHNIDSNVRRLIEYEAFLNKYNRSDNLPNEYGMYVENYTEDIKW